MGLIITGWGGNWKEGRAVFYYLLLTLHTYWNFYSAIQINPPFLSCERTILGLSGFDVQGRLTLAINRPRIDLNLSTPDLVRQAFQREERRRFIFSDKRETGFVSGRY